MTRPTLFLDLDGVLADFDSHAVQVLGLEPAATHPKDFWAAVGRARDFWENIPPFAYLEEFWTALADYRPIILTGLPATKRDAAERAKRAWVARHLGPDVPVICCWTREKPLHMRAPGDILVDDRPSNINEWNAAGGVGFVFDGPLPIIARVHEVMTRADPSKILPGGADPLLVERARALYSVREMDPKFDAGFLRGMASLAYSPRPQFTPAQARQINRLAHKYRRQIDPRLVPATAAKLEEVAS